MSHVVPDLIQKIIKGQDPVHILGNGEQVRHYTYGADLARGIILAMESRDAFNEDFNISTDESTTVLELAELIWKKINPDKPFRYILDQGFKYDVSKRIPSTDKARQILGFNAQTTLFDMLEEVIPWVREAIKANQI